MEHAHQRPAALLRLEGGDLAQPVAQAEQPAVSVVDGGSEADGSVELALRVQVAVVARAADAEHEQNAEQGLMPVIGDEAGEYGYSGENRHFVRCFLEGRPPELDFHAGLEVMELLMTAYMSAEQERTIAFKPDNLAAFVPAVAQGTWKP